MEDRLVEALFKSVVEENIEISEQLLENTVVTDKTDEYWKNSIKLYKSLSPVDRKMLLQIVKQTMVDSISNILGIIDGSSTIENFEDDFNLKYSDITLESDLQDKFLEYVEEMKE